MQFTKLSQASQSAPSAGNQESRFSEKCYKDKILDKNSTSYHLDLHLQVYLVGSQTKVLSLCDMKSHLYLVLKVYIY